MYLQSLLREATKKVLDCGLDRMDLTCSPGGLDWKKWVSPYKGPHGHGVVLYPAILLGKTFFQRTIWTLHVHLVDWTVWTLHVHLVDWTGWISHVHLVDWTGKNEFLLIKDHMAKDQGGLFSTPRNFLAYMVWKYLRGPSGLCMFKETTEIIVVILTLPF